MTVEQLALCVHYHISICLKLPTRIICSHTKRRRECKRNTFTIKWWKNKRIKASHSGDDNPPFHPKLELTELSFYKMMLFKGKVNWKPFSPINNHRELPQIFFFVSYSQSLHLLKFKTRSMLSFIGTQIYQPCSVTPTRTLPLARFLMHSFPFLFSAVLLFLVHVLLSSKEADTYDTQPVCLSFILYCSLCVNYTNKLSS